MPKQAWLFVGIFTALFALGGLGLYSRSLGQRLEQAQAELSAAQAKTGKQSADVETLRQQLAQQELRIQELRTEREAVVKAQKSLEDEMRAALQSKEVTISELQGKLTVNILDRILFDSGEATLRPEGEQVLRQIAGVLAQYPNRQVHVIGHTDNVPIRASARTRFASNWELSAGRALAAVRFLSEKAGVDSKRLGAVAYGEFRPLADNSTAEGRAKNRRIALVVLSDEVAGLDATTLAKRADAEPSPVAAATNAPAPELQVTNLPPVPEDSGGRD